MDVIYCAGGNVRLAKIAIEEGLLYGARSDDIRRGIRCDGLIDIRWNDYDWRHHVEMVALHKPKYAVAPDVEDTSEYPRLLELAHELEAYCGRTIMVPKVDGIAGLIPSRFLVGISVPTSYSGYLPAASEIAGRELHLLGGSPAQQRELWRYYQQIGATVVSSDLNCHNKASDFGSYWDGFQWRDNERDTIGKYEAFRKSCRGILRMWQFLGAVPVAAHSTSSYRESRTWGNS